MRSDKRVSITGPTGVGKSSVNQLVASSTLTGSTSWDDWIGWVAGLDAVAIFFCISEVQFRKWELELMHGFRLAAVTNAGGGMTLDSQNRTRSTKITVLSFGGTANDIDPRLEANSGRPQVLVRTLWELRLMACLVGTKFHLRLTKVRLLAALGHQSDLAVKSA